MVIQDQQGLNDIKSTKVNLQYSYELPLSKKFTVRAGLKGGYGTQSINYAQLYYPSQIDNQTGNVPVTGINGPASQKGYFDIVQDFLDIQKESGVVLRLII